MDTRWSRAACAVVACALLWPLSADAQDDVPDQELGLLPPEEDIKDNRSETPPQEKKKEADAPAPETRPAPSSSRRGASSGRGGQQTQVLGRGVLRVDAGPPDFTLLHSGMIGNGRGFVVGRADTRRTNAFGVQEGDIEMYAGMGLGVSYGVIENLEVGILQLPIIFTDGVGGDARFGNIEMHARYGIVSGGPVEFGAQLVVQVPSDLAFGVAMGLPLRIRPIDPLVIDIGIETEIVQYLKDSSRGRLNLVNLDVPVAINYYIVPEAFVGLRSGLFVLDFDDAYVPLGVQGGYTFADGLAQVTGWFQWAAIPLGEFRYSGDTLDAGSFEFGVGASLFFDLLK